MRHRCTAPVPGAASVSRLRRADSSLSFLLFLAGLELDFDRLRGRTLRTAANAFALSFALALGLALRLGGTFGAAGLVKPPLLIAVILAATSVGIVIPILVDSGQADTPLGRLAEAGGSLAEVIPVLLLSLLPDC